MFAFDKPLVWLIILVIVLVLFGASRLPDVGKSLGKSINNFKSEMTTEAKKPVGGEAANPPIKDDEVVVRKERTREDGTVEVVEERSVRKS
jgi:sec-independent protein translocase protein TatA